MRQIRLNEMTDRKKIQYVQNKKKKELKVVNLLIYGVPVLYFFVLIICAYIMPEDSNELPVLASLAAITIAIVLVGYKKYHKIMDMCDAIMGERVWEGYIDDFVLDTEYEFVDQNNQTLHKTFTEEKYKPYVNIGKIHVLCVSRLDQWYMEKGEA